MLKGHDPSVQGAVLAQLLAKWVAGHDETARIGLIEVHTDSVRRMVEIVLEEKKNGQRDQKDRADPGAHGGSAA